MEVPPFNLVQIRRGGFVIRKLSAGELSSLTNHHLFPRWGRRGMTVIGAYVSYVLQGQANIVYTAQYAIVYLLIRKMTNGTQIEVNCSIYASNLQCGLNRGIIILGL